MVTSKISKGRLLKVSAAAILSVGLLSACADDGDDDIIIDDPNGEEVNPEDDTDTNLDIDMDDGNDGLNDGDNDDTE